VPSGTNQGVRLSYLGFFPNIFVNFEPSVQLLGIPVQCREARSTSNRPGRKAVLQCPQHRLQKKEGTPTDVPSQTVDKVILAKKTTSKMFQIQLLCQIRIFGL